MAGTFKKSSDFQNYPFLTSEEFTEAAHHLDRRYIQASLGPLRRQWKLRVNTSLTLAFSPQAEYTTYVQIIRPLAPNLADDELSAALDKLSFGVTPTYTTDAGHTDADEQMLDAEDQDEVILMHML